MRIGSGSHRGLSTAQSDKRTVGGLQRSEFVSDIFNNREAKGSDKADFKLRLSHFSRKLAEDLKREANEFLKANPELAKDLQAIEVPDNAYRGNISSQNEPTRKLYVYMQWVRMRPQEGVEGAEEEVVAEAFRAVASHGKDEEIVELFASQDKKRQVFMAERQRHSPSYYYMAFPETYSFN